MQVTIHSAFITDGKHTLEIVSASHDDLIARIGAYCLQHWSSVSSGPPPENLKVLVDAYFASADTSIEFTREQLDLPEPYASAPRLLACLESLLADQSAYKPGDGEALAVLCSEILDARKVLAKASATLIPVVPTFTVFCQEASGQGTIHIAEVEAANLEDAITVGKQQCIDDWSTGPDDTRWNMETVHCLGVASGDVEILHWQDQPD